MPLSEREEQILIGTLLGDGHLELNGGNTRLKVDHCERHKDLVLWKHRELRTIACGEPRRLVVFDSRTGRSYKHFRFETRTIVDLNPYRKLFYPDGKKCVPSDISKMLTTPLGLAVWYMDDGHKRTDCRAL